jgi:hypothetical protein
MTSPDPTRAGVLWTKGQNFFAAFFAEIGNVRQQIGNEALFARWCIDDLHIPISVITQVSDVLSRVDAAKAKAELASAKAAEQEQRRKEKEEREAMLAAERKRKDEEKAEAAAEKARKAEIERQQKEAEEKKRRETKKNRKKNKTWKEKERANLKQALAELAGTEKTQNVVVFQNPQTPQKSEDQLAGEIMDAWKRREISRAAWIDASVELAGLLCEARARYPAHQRFNGWLEQHNIPIDIHDRAALLKLGQNVKAMRVILQQTDRTSYRYIWQDTERRIAHK